MTHEASASRAKRNKQLQETFALERLSTDELEARLADLHAAFEESAQELSPEYQEALRAWIEYTSLDLKSSAG